MEIFQIDDHGQLFISPDIDDWTLVAAQRITAIFDLDEAVDRGVPALANHLLYVYFPFEDKELPDLQHLHALPCTHPALNDPGAWRLEAARTSLVDPHPATLVSLQSL